MKKLQKGAWPQKPVKQAIAARACFRRFFAAHTPSPKPAYQARPKLAKQGQSSQSKAKAYLPNQPKMHQACQFSVDKERKNLLGRTVAKSMF